MSEIETAMVQANGLEFEVAQCGEGDRLALMLHGFPEHAYSWRQQMPLLAEMGYKAWAPNLRGYGKSARPPRKDDYLLKHLVADVAGLIDAAGCRETVLIGHDWGAAVAWTFALYEARPLQGLVIMNVPHPKRMLEGLKTWAQLRRSWYMFAFQLPWLPERLLLRDNARPVSGMIRATAADKTRFPGAVLNVYRENAAQPGALTAMLNYYRANVRLRRAPEELAILDKVIEVPTLMLWGEADTALGKELTYGTDELVRDLTLRYLPGVSHWVQQEAPEIVNAMLGAWLKGVPVPEADAVAP